MCGRFTLFQTPEQLVRRFSLLELPWDYTPSFNVAPTQMILAVLPGENREGRRAVLLRWGLTPPWQKPGSRPLINARLESLTEKPTFRGLVNNRRCLIPADGFFEWMDVGGSKQPVYFTLSGGKPFAFAGLWQDGQIPSCAIITQPASSLMKPIHDRMPLILTPETEELWLSSLPFPELLPHLPEQEGRPFAYHPVSKLVNSPANNSRACIEPLT